MILYGENPESYSPNSINGNHPAMEEKWIWINLFPDDLLKRLGIEQIPKAHTEDPRDNRANILLTECHMLNQLLRHVLQIVHIHNEHPPFN